MWIFRIVVPLIILGPTTCVGPDLMTLVKDHHIGSTFCQYLAWKMQIHHRTDCKQPTCNWDNWQDALNIKQAAAKAGKAHKESQQQRVVLSYGHNGFGNQLWEHTTAFMIAEALNAKLLIAIIPDELSPDGAKPPNTWAGVAAMKYLLPPEFIYDNLPADDVFRKTCEEEKFVVADRPRDWRNREYSTGFKENLFQLITDSKPRCIKLLGYFQNLPLCPDDVKKLWTPKMFGNFTTKPGENDVSVYLRCSPRHYHFNNREFYDNILARMSYDTLWLFMAPECPDPTKLDQNPERDGHVAGVVRLLAEKYKGKRWPGAGSGKADEVYLLHDLAGLAQSKRLVIPVSSWAFWAGMLSSATEIHVNAPPKHQLMPAAADQYIYHDEKALQFFGKFDKKEGDIVYTVDAKKEPVPAPGTALHINATSVATSAEEAKLDSLAAAIDAAKAQKFAGKPPAPDSSGANKIGTGKGHVKIDTENYNVGQALSAVKAAIKQLGG